MANVVEFDWRSRKLGTGLFIDRDKNYQRPVRWTISSAYLAAALGDKFIATDSVRGVFAKKFVLKNYYTS